jgi:hypothetical protein
VHILVVAGGERLCGTIFVLNNCGLAFNFLCRWWNLLALAILSGLGTIFAAFTALPGRPSLPVPVLTAAFPAAAARLAVFEE